MSPAACSPAPAEEAMEKGEKSEKREERREKREPRMRGGGGMGVRREPIDFELRNIEAWRTSDRE